MSYFTEQERITFNALSDQLYRHAEHLDPSKKWSTAACEECELKKNQGTNESSQAVQKCGIAGYKPFNKNSRD
ncbi:MAG: hypothetical protein HOJ17_07840 [Oceanospirillaceae bacterium]|nr:hypothetical protein [Oceanospirillaceae bacterium]